MIVFSYNKDDDGEIHFEKKHGVSIQEVEEFVLRTEKLINERQDESIEAIGKLNSGRYLLVAYRKIKRKDYLEYFIITAYDLYDETLKNLINKKIK